jgi:hypothetical protein
MLAPSSVTQPERKEKFVNAKNTFGILLVAALTVLLACTQQSTTVAAEQGAADSRGDRALPRGFQSYSDPHGSGRLILAKLPPGKHSARAVMRDSLGALKSYFDRPPQLLGGVSDSQDQVVQVIIGAKLGGQPLRGVATAAVTQSGDIFGLALDRPELLKDSFPALSRRLSQEMPKNSSEGGPINLSPPQQWKRQTAGDRTCAVDLPPGWQITGCNQGIATIVGPHKELIQLGLIFFVSTLPGAQGMAGTYLQPVPAFSYFVNYSTLVNRRNGVNIQNVPGRVLEVRDVAAPMQNGRGAYLLQEVSSNGQPAKVFALVYTVPNLMAGWTLYTSYVSAPSDLFAAEFADLMRIWNSWKVDDVVYQRQMQQTLESMHATRDILRHGTERQMHAYDNLEESMGLIIRGEDRVENKSLGGRADVYTQNTDAVLHTCQQRGYDCQRVPFNELTRP